SIGNGVLEVLQHPEPATVVEGDAHGLADHRLVGQELDLKPPGHLESRLRLLGRQGRRHVPRQSSPIARQRAREKAPQNEKDEDGRTNRHGGTPSPWRRIISSRQNRWMNISGAVLFARRWRTTCWMAWRSWAGRASQAA